MSIIHQRKKSSTTTFEALLGSTSRVNTLYVWFPAVWMPLVVEAVRARTVSWIRNSSQPGAVACAADEDIPVPANRELSFRLKRYSSDPMLPGRSRPVHAGWGTAPSCPHAGLFLFRMKRHLWPMQMTAQLAAADIPTVTFMSRERRRLKTRYIWETIDINSTLLGKKMMASHPTGVGGTNSITGSF